MNCNFNLLLLLILVAIVTAKGVLNGNERISNGELATNEEFPFIVSLTKNYSHICGGFVYNSRFVVTAANCVDGKSKDALKVHVGQFSLIVPEEGEQTIDVSSIIIFEGYNNESKLHDIALVETSRQIVFSSRVEYIQYSDVDETLSYGIFAGWGAKTDGGLESTKLYKINLTLPADCSSYSVYEKDYMLCAGSDQGSPCKFDEGSPLVQSNVVVGIMSKSLGCTSPSSTVFTRVAAYYPWLMKFAGVQPERGLPLK